MKENGFTLKKARCRKYPAEIITNGGYADDIPHLVNAPTKAQSLLHSLEQAAGGIDLHINADKTNMYLNEGDMFTLKVGSLKVVDKFMHLSSSVSSTENGINTRLAKAWTAIDRLSIWYIKQNKTEFPLSSFCVNTTVRIWYKSTDKTLREKAIRELQKNSYELHWTNQGSNSTWKYSYQLLFLKQSK